MADVAPFSAWADVPPRSHCQPLGALSRQQPQRTLSSPAFERSVLGGTSRSSVSYFEADKFLAIDSCSPLTGDRPSSSSSAGHCSKPAWSSNSMLPECSDRSLESLRDERMRPSSASSAARRTKHAGSVRENSRDRSMRQSLQPAKRTQQKQDAKDEGSLTHQQSQQDLIERLRMVTLQLKEETRARKEQELVSEKLALDLQEAHLQLALLSEYEVPCDRPVLGSKTLKPSTRPSADQLSTAVALRLEHERLRERERDQRRRRRLAQPRQSPVDEADGSPEISNISCEASEALEEALAQAQAARAMGAEAHEVARAALDENKHLRRQLEAVHSELESERVKQYKLNQEVDFTVRADTRLQNLTKVVNEIALQADLRQLGQLEHLATQATDLFETEAV